MATTRKAELVDLDAVVVMDVVADEAVKISHKLMTMPTPKSTKAWSSVTLVESTGIMLRSAVTRSVIRRQTSYSRMTKSLHWCCREDA